MARMNVKQCESIRTWRRTVLLIAVWLITVLLPLGCDKRARQSGSQVEPPQTAPIDWMMKARRQVDLGQHDAAAESVSRALIETPDRPDVIYLAAQIAALRGRADEAAELAGTIPLSNDRFGSQATELRLEQLIRGGQHDAATELLFELANQQPDQPAWRHLLWRELNYQGRRQEASEQADRLCALGESTLAETMSLIARDDAFPMRLRSGEKLEEVFHAGLGRARWYFTQRDFQRGLAELQSQWEQGFTSAAASALYGRLLAESQAFDQLNFWHAKTDEDVRQMSDYWAAVGASLMAAGRHEAATRAFLEAISRDATDRLSYQRLYRTLAALGRDEDAEQILMLSNQVNTSQRLFSDMLASPNDRSLWQKQAEWLSKIGRPLEAIAWYSHALPAGAIEQRRAIEQHRVELQRLGDFRQIQLNVARAAIDPDEFALQPALDETLGRSETDGKSVRAARPQSPSVIPRLVDVASSIGVDFQWYHDTAINLDLLSLYESLGGGIAVIDVDLDGWPDLYLAQGSGSPPSLAGTRSNQLLRNEAFVFQNVTLQSATEDTLYTQGLAAGDVNQDGFPDLFIAEIGANRLLINNGDGTFSDHSAQTGWRR